MNKIKRVFALGAIFWGATNLSQDTLAQPLYSIPIVPIQPAYDYRKYDYGSNSRPRGNGPTPRTTINGTPSRNKSTSRYTRRELRKMARYFNQFPRGRRLRQTVCSGDGDTVLLGQGFNLGDIAIFKEELGC
jgi:hypothetical protein